VSQSAIEESVGFVAGGKSPQHVADWRHGHFSWLWEGFCFFDLSLVHCVESWQQKGAGSGALESARAAGARLMLQQQRAGPAVITIAK
jgi:hypothetical protein